MKCYAMNCTYNIGMTCTYTDIQFLKKYFYEL
ncbi:hypothetical protein ACV3QH_03995 [Clostridium perfringens]